MNGVIHTRIHIMDFMQPAFTQILFQLEGFLLLCPLTLNSMHHRLTSLSKVLLAFLTWLTSFLLNAVLNILSPPGPERKRNVSDYSVQVQLVLHFTC